MGWLPPHPRGGVEPAAAGDQRTDSGEPVAQVARARLGRAHGPLL